MDPFEGEKTPAESKSSKSDFDFQDSSSSSLQENEKFKNFEESEQIFDKPQLDQSEFRHVNENPGIKYKKVIENQLTSQIFEQNRIIRI